MVTSTDSLDILQRGKITVRGEFVWGSNYTFLVEVESEGGPLQAVYKPTRGERPLWDFPVASLAKREAAAYWVSQSLGWDLVPPTVYRTKGPVGAGSLQLYIEHDPEYHYFNFKDEDRQRLRPVVLFDLLINNADRKGSHILVDADRRLWLIDHGVCFHIEEKLRTVIWDFVGEPIPNTLLVDLHLFSQKLLVSSAAPDNLNHNLVRWLSQGEIRALARRARDLVEEGCYPAPKPNRRPYPWPAI